MLNIAWRRFAHGALRTRFRGKRACAKVDTGDALPTTSNIDRIPSLARVVFDQMVESEVKEEFVKHMASTLDWGALCKAASEVSM